MRRRRPPRRKIRFNGKIKNGFLKTFFVQTVLCMIIILAVIIYINIEKNGIDAIRSNFTNEENSLAGLTTQIKTLFDRCV